MKYFKIFKKDKKIYNKILNNMKTKMFKKLLIKLREK